MDNNYLKINKKFILIENKNKGLIGKDEVILLSAIESLSIENHKPTVGELSFWTLRTKRSVVRSIKKLIANKILSEEIKINFDYIDENFDEHGNYIGIAKMEYKKLTTEKKEDYSHVADVVSTFKLKVDDLRKRTTKINLENWLKSFSFCKKENENFNEVFIWYINNMGRQFIPEAYCADTFRKKFNQIEMAMLRNKKGGDSLRDLYNNFLQIAK